MQLSTVPSTYRLTFDGQHLRYATRERCLAAEWDTNKGYFKKSFSGYHRLRQLRTEWP